MNNYLSLLLIAFIKMNLDGNQLGGCFIDLDRGQEVRKYAYCFSELSSQLIIYGVVSFAAIVALVKLNFKTLIST